MADGPRDAGRRDVALLVRLTPEERDALHAAARASGRSQTAAWVRNLAMAAAAGMPAPRPRNVERDNAALAVLSQLRRIGNNLNQLARASNAGGGIEAEALARIAAECAAVRTWAEAQE